MNGSVTLLESETGSGKTEAALTRFVSLYRAGLVDSMMLALPTRTSAVQIHARIHDGLKRIFGDAAPPAVLAVPGYARVDDVDGVLSGLDTLWDDDRDSIGFRGWAAENPKRFLAAPVAVGTIDQVLLAVLNAKHGSMRWACLSRTFIVVDEVHASDPYMRALLLALLRQHIARSGHAFLMSATLGSSAATDFLNVAGTSVMALDLPAACGLSYPLLRIAAADAVRQWRWDQVDDAKRVSLITKPLIADPDAIANSVAEHVRNGAKVLVIRNTVVGCIAVQKSLERILGPDMVLQANGVPCPHHGRYAPEDRKLLDTAVEAALGKKSPRRGVAVVATQTVEQSLDIDADILVTDLCPMDVLLQRIGRLHRHRLACMADGHGSRPLGYEAAQCIVLTPSHEIIAYAAKAADGFGIERAYADLRVVEATLRLVCERREIEIPRDNRELVELSTHPEVLARIQMSSPDWASHGAKVDGLSMGDKAIAKMALRSTKWRNGDVPEAGGLGQVATRLGESDATAILDNPVRSPFGSSLRVLRIPHWMAPSNAKDDKATVTGVEAGGFVFRLGDSSYRYDKLGLRKD